jgi:hypothetical protein
VVLLLHLALGLSIQTDEPDWSGDWAGYLMQAQCLQDNSWTELAAQTTFRQAYSQPMDSPDYYPWGFPVWLLPAVAWFANPFPPAKLSLLLCAVVILWAIRSWLRPYLSPLGQVILVSWLAMHHWLIWFSQLVLSDLPFWLVSAGWFWAVDRWVMRQPPAQRQVWQTWCVGLLLFGGIWLRSQGWVWVMAMPCLQILARWQQGDWREPWRDLWVYLSLGLLWVLYHWLLPYRPGYLRFFPVASMPATVVEMTVYYAKVGYKFFEQGRPGAAWTVPLGLLSAGLTLPWLIRGIWHSLPRHLGWVCTSALLMATLLIYPYKEGFRFLWPLLPLGLFWVITGVESSQGLWRKAGRAWLCLMVVSTLAGTLVRAWPYWQGDVLTDGPMTTPAQEVWAYLEDQVAPEQSITFSKPRILTYLTGHPAAFALSRHYPSQETDLLLVPTDTLANLADSVAHWLAQQPLCFENEGFQLYQLRPISAVTPGGEAEFCP